MARLFSWLILYPAMINAIISEELIVLIDIYQIKCQIKNEFYLHL